jgi:high-affinity iron transporter
LKYYLSILLFACSGPPGESTPSATTAAGVDARGPLPSGAGAGQGSAPAPHDAHSAHMAQMSTHREALRAELGAAYDAPVPGLELASASRGRQIYDAHCATCHGAAGRGDGPGAAGLTPAPGDLTDAFHARYYADAGRVQIIRKGSPDTSMAGFEGTLTAEQVLDVYAFVKTLRGD